MTLENVVWLIGAQAQNLLQTHASDAPAQFAMHWQPKLGANAALIATQLHLRQKASIKLPTWVAAGCLFHPEGYEQATAEATLQLKAQQRGDTAIDLTAGLGVDAWHLAKQFAQVIALERDPVRAALLRHNLARLSTPNVTIIETESMAWLYAYQGSRFDLIYIDPARRKGARAKAIALADMEPNLASAQSLLLQKASRVVVKLSPLFELAELPRVFTQLASVQVLSVSGECKEVVATLSPQAGYNGDVQAAMLLSGGPRFFSGPAGMPQQKLAHQGRYLYEPDVAFYKADLLGALQTSYSEHLAVYATGKAGFLLSDSLISDFPGRTFQVISALPYKPSTLLAYRKANQLDKANVTRRAFPLTVAELRKTLKLTEGGDDYLFFTETPAGLYCYHTRKVVSQRNP